MENKSTVLKRQISKRNAAAIVGCHDALGARLTEECGFQALQISGLGMSGSLMCRPDIGLVQMEDLMEITWNIIQAVNVPVITDIDTGGGNAINAMWIAERLIDMGVAGLNIEDQIFPKRCGHMYGKEVIETGEMSGKIRAIVDVKKRLDPDVVIGARTDSYAVHGLDESIRRCNIYLKAGANIAIIDGIRTKEEIQSAVKALKGPLSVNLMDGVSGIRTTLIPVPELAAMGVGRVSIPTASIMVMHKALKNFFTTLKNSSTGLLEGQDHWLSSFQEYTDLVGLPWYRELENNYLPKNKLKA